ncbi:nuclear transport factor 2 family protein [Nocardia niwae]|uniref:Nuclear transport factor 2 family protein n=1 Tax=Nocardia niwae TaxID=626084 RepID=A0ABV2XKH9_9NOCA|nr:nuclear transport factor 2 family protein [Nocardia niwae]
MSDPIALRTSLAFYRAWTEHDFDNAMTYVADDIVCDAPAGRIAGAAAFRDFLEPFSRILTDSTLLASFGDEHTALLMYDTVTIPVANAPGAEWHTVVDGRITYVRIIFDRAPFDAVRAAAREADQ